VGSKHVITLNDEGYCYTYGSNEKLQLGREGDNSLIPKKSKLFIEDYCHCLWR